MTQKRFGYLILPLSLALAAALGLTACDGGSTGAISSPAPSSASQGSSKVTSPSPSIPTSSAVYQPATLTSPAKNVPIPVKPSEADEFSEKGLKAFALYWYKMYNYSIQTGDVKKVEKFTKSDCLRCTIVFQDIEDWYKSGNWRTGGQIIITKTQLTKSGFKQASNGSYQYMVQYNKSGGGYVTKNQKTDRSYPPTVAGGDLINAVYGGASWMILDIGKIGS